MPGTESAKLSLSAKSKKKRVQIAVKSYKVCCTFLGEGGEVFSVPVLTCIAKSFL